MISWFRATILSRATFFHRSPRSTNQPHERVLSSNETLRDNGSSLRSSGADRFSTRRRTRALTWESESDSSTRLFDQVVAGTIDEAGRVGLRDRLIAGLEAIQGVRRQPQATFLVVDPAFTSHRSSASVVARQLPGSSITFMSQREWWIAQSEGSAELASALDWSDRSVIVEFDTEAGHRPLQIQLDLLRFELVLRYADGLTARDHFHADLRRLSSRLAKLATATDSSEVTVLVRGERKKLSIDVGNRIRALDG